MDVFALEYLERSGGLRMGRFECRVGWASDSFSGSSGDAIYTPRSLPLSLRGLCLLLFCFLFRIDSGLSSTPFLFGGASYSQPKCKTTILHFTHMRTSV